ncbi:TetR/AcrR family transcriptional regulator [Dactylosporangium sp. CA-139066]|uniref:TetR/AcrR family transcriptional regulator n=1 Tax=Dactylosporangium sp. CA-139066 TaxID=3239930 RepID=UPI003D8CD8C1
MTSGVNPKRRYESPRRREQAEATRRQIRLGAQRLFEEQGYLATTMAAVATEAGVSLKTVYLAFDTKSRLLRAVWDVLLRGEEDRPVAQVEWFTEMMAEPDPVRQLRLNARNSRRAKERIGPLLRAIRNAAPQDPDVDALWELIQTDFHANQRVIVESLKRKHALKKDVDEATDILWALNHPDVWHLLTGRRGWTPERYEQWFGDASISELLGTPVG